MRQLPVLFLAISDWFLRETCVEMLRNDLVNSTNGKAIHPFLEGKISLARFDSKLSQRTRRLDLVSSFARR